MLQFRPLVERLLHLPVQLARHDDRAFQRAGQRLQLARALRHLLFAVASRPFRHPQQLQVVHHHQVHPVARMHHPRLRTQLVDAQIRLVVHQQRTVVQFAGLPEQLVQFLLRHPSPFHLRIQSRRAHQQQPFPHLLAHHLQGEQQHMMPSRSRLHGKLQSQLRLSHGRSSRREDQVARLPSSRHTVQFRDACGDTRHPVHAPAHPVHDPVARLLHHRLHVLQVAPQRRPFHDLLHVFLHPHDHFEHILREVAHLSHPLVQPRQHPPPQIQLIQHMHMVVHEGPVHHAARHHRHAIRSARLFQAAHRPQLLRHQKQVRLHALGHQRPQCDEHHTYRFRIKKIRFQ